MGAIHVQKEQLDDLRGTIDALKCFNKIIMAGARNEISEAENTIDKLKDEADIRNKIILWLAISWAISIIAIGLLVLALVGKTIIA